MIALGSDHAGYKLKEAVRKYLDEQHIEYKDFGTFDENPVDYPDIIVEVSKYVAKEQVPGIIVCGTGIGSSMVANKVHGIRAALCHNVYTAEMARKHNDANVLVLGGRVVDEKTALEMVKIFLATEFEAGRHARRVEKIMDVEKP